MNYTISNNGNKSKLELTMDGITIEEAAKIIAFCKGTQGLTDVDRECIRLINEGSLLMAVKHYKEQTGNGLKESKEYCDKLKTLHCK